MHHSIITRTVAIIAARQLYVPIMYGRSQSATITPYCDPI